MIRDIPHIPLITARVNLERSALVAAAMASNMSAEAYEDFVAALYDGDPDFSEVCDDE